MQPVILNGVKKNFLQNGDKAVIVLYNEKDYTEEEIRKMVGRAGIEAGSTDEKDTFIDKKISVLIQTVVV